MIYPFKLIFFFGGLPPTQKSCDGTRFIKTKILLAQYLSKPKPANSGLIQICENSFLIIENYAKVG